MKGYLLRTSDECNNNCTFCDNLGFKSYRKDFEQIKCELRSVKEKTIILPCNIDIRPDFDRIIELIISLKKHISIITNAQAMNVRKKLLSISKIDDISIILLEKPQTHVNITQNPASFHHTINGIIKMLEYGNNIKYYKLNDKTEIQTTFSKKNFQFPKRLWIEPTNQCNLECEMCVRTRDENNKPSMLSFQNFIKIKDQIKGIEQIYFFHYGEPFLNKEIYKMINISRDVGENIISTNGHFIDPEKIILSELDTIVFSLDGASDETYKKYRKNGDFDKVCSNINQLADMKKTLNKDKPIIIIQFLVNKQNEHEKEEIIKLANRLGANQVNFKTISITGFDEKIKDYLPKDLSLSRYKNNKLEYNVERNNYCLEPFQSMVINANGDVLPCCHCENSIILGNIHNNSIKDIWNSELYNSFRVDVIKDINKHKICKNCKRNIESNIIKLFL